jgi:hypothetical protein
MPGRANQPRKADEVKDSSYVEAEKDTQERIDALKSEVDGHFHTGKPEDEAEVHTGVCHGGPMNGMEGESRHPKGFVLLDEKDSRAWVYDRHGDAFIARKVEPLNRVGAEKAAEEANYDVRAYDRETMGTH